jgi:hypothetical protein
MGTESSTIGERRPVIGPLVVCGWLLLALLAVVAGPAIAAPPRPADENGLTENETATLWSGDNDSRYLTSAAYERAYGESRPVLHEIGNATDWTFTEPPETAALWTRVDHRQFPVGDETVSYHPLGANLTESRFLADAHISVFSVSPATVAHLGPGTGETVQYLAPTGQLRAVIDYRIRLPRANESAQRGNETLDGVDNESRISPLARGNTTAPRVVVSWRVLKHDIDEVRLYRDGVLIDRIEGTHWPVLGYTDLDGGDARLTVEANVSVALERTTTVERVANTTGPNGTVLEPALKRTVEVLNETVTLTDTVEGRVYDLEATVSYATYPDGTTGVAVYQTGPWQGYTLTADETVRVRGVWRFYTARDSRWDELVRSEVNSTKRVASPSLPVAVHAYPSTLGPRVEPVGRGIELLEVWGIERESPEPTLGEHIHVDVVTEPYWTSYGLAVRTQRLDRDALRLHGIVRGVEVVPATTAGPTTTTATRELRESTLSATVIERSASGLTVEFQLVDAETSTPIWLGAVEEPRYAHIVESERSGYLVVGDQRVTTNDAGVAIIQITEPGVYTAQYVPGSWLSHDPAYTESSATVRWHPFMTAEAWLTFAVEVGLALVPLGLALYMARRLGDLLRYRHGGDSA